jgi:membrane protein insertase Oxa1/YidC/SpoIIIJ
MTLIHVTIFMNSDARISIYLLIQNVLQVIQTFCAAHAYTMEVALAHTCMAEAPHATKHFISEQVIAQLALCLGQMASVTPNA